MKNRLIICLAIAMSVAFLASLHTAQSQEYYTYTVHLRQDGSAVWTITQFSDINTSATSWTSYQQKIYSLVNQASNATHRSMAVDDSSLGISTTLSPESKITEYTFAWLNCSTNQDNELVFGDVLKTGNFFGQLFGDASIQLTYPQELMPQSVYPPPYERQDSLYVMKWARTQDLSGGNVKIVLAQSGQSSGGDEAAQSSFIGLAVAGVAVPVGVVGFFVFRKRQNSKQATMEVAVPSAIESDDDKILKLLKTSGGSMRQTEITERLGYSKAKTSQLLTALETSGVLARYKKGRDKIVTFRKGED